MFWQWFGNRVQRDSSEGGGKITAALAALIGGVALVEIGLFLKMQPSLIGQILDRLGY